MRAHAARVTQDNMYKQQQIKHQSNGDSQNFANVAATVESCGQPESDAIVFADILLDYDQDTENYDRSARYSGTRTQTPGTYQVLIPTSEVSVGPDK